MPGHQGHQNKWWHSTKIFDKSKPLSSALLQIKQSPFAPHHQGQYIQTAGY